MNNNQVEFFYCYNRRTFEKLKEHGLHPIITARHMQTHKIFNQYVRNSKLNNALDYIAQEQEVNKNENDSNQNEFFYCYSKALADHINSKGINPITVARNPNNNNIYSMFRKTDSLQSAIKEYQNK